MSKAAYRYTVSQLNLEAKQLLEQGLPPLWVEAEVSNMVTPASGHWYLTLKDHRSQVRAAMFRTRNRMVRQLVKNGDQVLVRGRVSLYEPRGDYQFIIEEMQAAGEGLLRLQFDQLKAKLEQEGLFSTEHKRPLPEFCQRIGVISSPSGAVVHDIISAAKRRNPATEIVIYPSAVQGSEAPAELRKALAMAVQRNEVDAIIIGRGGGSLEDLWAFNDEQLARDVFNCPLPIVSAVGHEVDVSICDWVADLRAPTPTAAAELLTKDQNETLGRLAYFQERLSTLFSAQLRQSEQRLQRSCQLLKAHSPQRRFENFGQRIDRLELALQHGLKNQLANAQTRLAATAPALARANPANRVAQTQQQLAQLQQRLNAAQQSLQDKRQQRLTLAAAKLNTVSPLATLDRGYAIAQAADGKVVHSADAVNSGDGIVVRLHKGELDCTVNHARSV